MPVVPVSSLPPVGSSPVVGVPVDPMVVPSPVPVPVPPVGSSPVESPAVVSPAVPVSVPASLVFVVLVVLVSVPVLSTTTHAVLSPWLIIAATAKNFCKSIFTPISLAPSSAPGCHEAPHTCARPLVRSSARSSAPLAVLADPGTDPLAPLTDPRRLAPRRRPHA